ncbi:hypothetical protein QR680_003322 [Steinernema hermaphroditum]|uniref:Uncharacterized protein n=1 Tax=Steinernema hermaphroditum TaxID=289476 RepID=A0AA39H8G2_9BILA|nr:hypothetical protein QR680_003322 [Steinernema hermaphroditum]
MRAYFANNALMKFQNVLKEQAKRVFLAPRKLLVALCILIFLLYCLLGGGDYSSTVSSSFCVANHWGKNRRGVPDDGTHWTHDASVAFVGNGHIGIDVSKEREVRIAGSQAKIIDFRTGFKPLLNIRFTEGVASSDEVLTDFDQGIVRLARCVSLADQCICSSQNVYIHRSRPNLLVQEIQIVNPGDRSVTFEFSVDDSKDWTKGDSLGGSAVFTRIANVAGDKFALAAVCSSVPDKVTIREKREETFRFMCVFEQKAVEKEKTEVETLQVVSLAAMSNFATYKNMNTVSVDMEHYDAWKSLNNVTFVLSHSKAPNVLNADLLNYTKYALLSNSKAPLLSADLNATAKKTLEDDLTRNELCYTGHPTLLYPSKLWNRWNTVEDLLRTMELWILTFEKRGCQHMLKGGAHGVGQAFVLSLGALSFTHNHLEMNFDPADLHREIEIANINVGSARVSIQVDIDAENKPILYVSSSTPMFACDAACLDPPVAVGPVKLNLPVKVTKPLTPILYVASERKHLQQLRDTIHVVEVAVAPSHENDVIAIHKHGHRLGGLPTVFWMFLGILVIAFHVFLLKLLYSEWIKKDYTPYNAFLRARYMREH